VSACAARYVLKRPPPPVDEEEFHRYWEWLKDKRERYGLEPFRFPEPGKDETRAPPSPINYVGTVRVTPVVDGDRSFVEWWVSFEGADGERKRWQRFLVHAIAQ
jgi:hypothetical protein